ncbi:MAG: hypothetical protein AAGC93_28740 [Cyanobacteria bacterium P01_F01_bin.53]
MRSKRSVPYVLKLPPYNFTPLLNGLTTFLAWVLLLGGGVALGLLLIFIAKAKGTLAGVLWVVGMAIPWAILVIDDIYFHHKRAYRKFNLYAKWCYVPKANNNAEGQKKAWLSSKGPRMMLDEPGFYILKAGYYVMFVGTTQEWESFLELAMNGGL